MDSNVNLNVSTLKTELQEQRRQKLRQRTAKAIKRYNKRWRKWLRLQLGGKCAQCGTTRQLTFDLIVPWDNGAHWKKSSHCRIAFYRREYDKGNVQLLCINHNRIKGNNLQLNPNLIDTPF